MTLSKERLEEMRDYDTCVTLEESAAMASELLERRERDKHEPVAWGLFHFASGEFYNACSSQGAAERHLNQVHQSNDSVTLIIRPLYAAPPAPVVPEEMPAGLAGQIVSLCAFNIRDKELAQKIWSACRADMLQSFGNSEQLNSPAIPDGWKLVPVDATRAMIDAAARVEEDGYDAMHKAMLAAAPKREIE